MLITARVRGIAAAAAALADRARGAPDRLQSRLFFRVLPTDLDLNLHLTNSRYAQWMDVGRLDLLLRAGLVGELWRTGTSPVVVEFTTQFRRELRLGQRVEVVTEAVRREGRALWLEQTFRVGPTVHAVARVKLLAVRGGRAVDLGPLGVLCPPAPDGGGEGAG
jgi:acyl-CoA thioesterase FadM